MAMWSRSKEAAQQRGARAGSEGVATESGSSEFTLDDDKDVFESEAPVAAQTPGTRVAKRAARPTPPRDPLVQALGITILVIIILTLVTVAYALFTGVFGNGAPRTSSEQRIMAAAAKVEAGSVSAADWTNYIRALIEEGQYGKAQQAINDGSKKVKDLNISADMTYMQAELYLSQDKL